MLMHLPSRDDKSYKREQYEDFSFANFVSSRKRKTILNISYSNMKTYVLDLLVIVFLFQCSHEKPTIKIADNQMGMIGYGSLMSLKSMQRTLKRKYSDSIYRVHLKGYKREWTFLMKNDDPNLTEEELKYDGFFIQGIDTIPFQQYVSLNIAEDKPTNLNCILYILPKNDLKGFDDRELGYKRIDVTDKIVEYNFEGGRVFAYIATPEYHRQPEPDPRLNIVPKWYVDLVTKACDSIGVSFRKEYDNTTTPYNSKIVAERVYWKKAR